MEKQVVLVIGAGASKALNPQFALGQELLQQISDRVTDRNTNQPYLSGLLNNRGFAPDIRQRFVENIDRYKATTEEANIDGFIDEVSSYPKYRTDREQFIQIAKFSVLFHVLGYEAELKRSPQQFQQQPNWIDKVAEFIRDHRVLYKTTSTLKIITFNYDRNIEHLLYNHPFFHDQSKRVKYFIDTSITHIYGRVGSLEWERCC